MLCAMLESLHCSSANRIESPIFTLPTKQKFAVVGKETSDQDHTVEAASNSIHSSLTMLFT